MNASVAPDAIRESAPAKINLALSVTGKRDDGHHLLDTLVAFADIADDVTAVPADGLCLSVGGRQAGHLPLGEDNLVLAGALRLRDRIKDGISRPSGAALGLVKRLPVAAGIGGGSADAAACLRALNRLWKIDLDRAELARIGLELGADVPMCVHSSALRARGIGEDLEVLPHFPVLHLVLVNPQIPISTSEIFTRLEKQDGPALPDPPRLAGFADVADYLCALGNDLTETVIRIAPPVGEVLKELSSACECRLARMSGSGATCFGLFPDRGAAVRAAVALAARHRDWWVVATRTLSGGD